MYWKSARQKGNVGAKNRQRAGNPVNPSVSKLAFEVSSPYLSPRRRLLMRILALRDSIEAEKGILSESYPLIRGDREGEAYETLNS